MSVLLLTLFACESESACEALHNAATACDLVPRIDTCDAPLLKQIELLRGVRDDGCGALYEPDGTMREEACALYGWDCPPPLYETPAELAVNPIVFVSGVDDSPLFDWNPDLIDAVGEHGPVHHVRLPGWTPTSERAEVLWDTLVALPAGRVNLVCWAVGGIDCRYLASPGGLFENDPAGFAAMQERVASISTLATPHRGTNVADAVLTLPDGELHEVLASGVLGSADSLDAAERDRRLVDVLEALSLDGMRTFNQRTPDAPDVLYQSWAGVSYAFDQTFVPTENDIAAACASGDGSVRYRHYDQTHDAMTDALWLVAPFAEVAVGRDGQRSVGPSDGMIAVDSARWGVFQGCLPADHYDVVGRTGFFGTDPITGFNAEGFLLEISGTLARVGL